MQEGWARIYCCYRNVGVFENHRCVLQIFSEIDERLRFQEDMAGVRGAAETCRTINLEVMQRVQELQKLGVDVSAARRKASLDSQHLFG